VGKSSGKKPNKKRGGVSANPEKDLRGRMEKPGFSTEGRDGKEGVTFKRGPPAPLQTGREAGSGCVNNHQNPHFKPWKRDWRTILGHLTLSEGEKETVKQ